MNATNDSQSPEAKLGINVPNPQHAIHIRLENGSEFTDEDIRHWAEGELTNVGEESMIIKYLAQIIVARVL